MSGIPTWMRREVVARADRRCEYCRLSQAAQEAAFHVDHIHPMAEGGETVLENLALACVSCSLRKGARLRVLDPKTRREVRLFHPRADAWTDHFSWKGNQIQGRTASGRATIALLKLNRPLALAIRSEERMHGRHPG